MRNVQPGDILLYRISKSSNWLDKLIGWGQRVIHEAPTLAAYCHVALVGPDDEHCYEAVWPRLRRSPIDFEKLERDLIVEVYRVSGITPEQVAKVIGFAEKRVGRRYDLLAILTFGKLQVGPAAVCSQYVWESFTAAGICLCPWADLESPDDIAASPKLTRIS